MSLSLRFLFLLLVVAARAAEPAPAIDWNRARELHHRSQRGEKLTDDEQQFLDRARRMRAAGQQPEASKPVTPAAHYTPLTELKAEYQGEDGGLYGGGQNSPPEALSAAANRAVTSIRPLDSGGAPAAAGKIVLMSIGMSNTTQEFSVFKAVANADSRKADEVVIVDAAQGGQDAPAWSRVDAGPWKIAEERLRDSGVTPAQVQAVWLKQAIKGPSQGFSAETDRLAGEIRKIVDLARTKYPNLRVIFLSSRIYAGYARTKLNPEPYAYESAFGVRKLIREQQLSADFIGPVLLWGPYLWADGKTGRAADGLAWLPEDFASDGTHPSNSGRNKVARLLLDFFTSDRFAKSWFVKQP